MILATPVMRIGQTIISRKSWVVFRQTLALILLLFYPFNSSISDKILLGTYNPFVFTALGLLLLIPNLKKKLTPGSVKVLLLEISIVIYTICSNEAIYSAQYIFKLLLIQIMYVLLVPILLNINIEKKAITLAIGAFLLEHMIGTIIPIVSPGLYEDRILPFLCAGSYRCFARNGFLSGNNAGLTTHYTTNGAYLSLSVMFFAARYFDKKNKSNLFFLILSVIGLLVIGKRAHFIFTVISIIFGYAVERDDLNLGNFLRKNAKIIIISVFGIIITMCMSTYIPQLSATFGRISELSHSDDVLNGRGALYELANTEWRKSIFFGNGWGHYINESHKKFGIKQFGTDYIHTHNDYLEILCDTGIFGLIIFVIFLLWILIVLYRKRCEDSLNKFIFMYMIFYILYGFTGTPLNIIVTFCFLLVSLIYSLKENEQ